MNHLKKAMTWMATYLAIYGLFGFGLFILEESIQSLQFGGWQFEKTGSHAEILLNSDLMEDMNVTMRLVNNIGGWMNPIGFIAYNNYAKATDRYITALRTTVFANAPELMDGRAMTVDLRYQFVEPAKTGFYAVAGPVRVWCRDFPGDPVVHKAGIVRCDKKNAIVEIR